MRDERLLQYIWQRGLFRKTRLRTTCGEKVEVIRAGEQNMNAGPDFINARILIGRIQWAGCVEVHPKSSDWRKHGHQLDPSYDNVILHVVDRFDEDVFNTLGRRIQTLIMDYPEQLESIYRSILESDTWLPCAHFLPSIPASNIHRWLTLLQKERLEYQSQRIFTFVNHGERNWEEQFYIAIATGFGLPINSLPFNLLASSIPLALLLEHRDHFTFLEAMLYGQAGFLDSRKIDGPYMSTLTKLFQDNRSCISRRPIPEHLWKFLRLRPASFPTLRISQFAGLIHRHFPMMHLIMNAVSLTEIEQLLRVRASEYWNTHYLFGKYSPESEKYTGTQFSHTMIINTVVPFLTAIDRYMPHHSLLHRGRTLLQQLEAESNHIIKNWAKFGIKAGNAMESQALIQLRNAYCRERRCLDCQLGKSLIESTAEKEEGWKQRGENLDQ